ncbi:MAG: hypothetical protein Ct9H90mP13_02100 [Pseudomonadota bacterium]|nr:MAG: hypothetical protein Ct9H90mP13_02100 [Pseudomonadota bacterium]
MIFEAMLMLTVSQNAPDSILMQDQIGTRFSELKSPSLFAEKKIIEINLPLGRPGKSGSAALLELMETVTDDHLLILILEN